LAITTGCSSDNDRSASSMRTDRGYEVSRTESDKTGWFGGQTHAVNTVYKNSDGSTSVQTETTTTKGNDTTITRERRTTAVDGTVKTDREMRTITKGTDNVQRESSSSTN
jgi:hypothetical protein